MVDCEDNAAEILCKAEFINNGRAYLGCPAIYHYELSPGCFESIQTPRRCMEVGRARDGLDCSGLVIEAMKLASWPSRLRHTREMFAALEAAGGKVKPFREVRAEDIGNLVFSRLLEPGDGPAIAHVSILTGFTDAGKPIALQAQASYEGRVVERPLNTPDQPRERLIMSSLLLAELALAA